MKKKTEEKFSERVSTLLQDYKGLIDFSDSMEKNNFKFVDQYIRRQKRKLSDWENDCFLFLKDAISIHKNYLREKKMRTQIK